MRYVIIGRFPIPELNTNHVKEFVRPSHQQQQPPTSKSTTQLFNNNILGPRLSTTCASHLSQPSFEHSTPSPTPVRTSSASTRLPYRLSSEGPSSDLCPQFLSSAPCSAALTPEKCRIPSRKVKMSGVRC